MIRVVVIDDSAFMRKALTTMLEKDPDIKVVATARNGADGLTVIRQHDPDVVTLDIEMPQMDGLTALRHIMMEMPRPVLMISSLTMEGAESTLKAMELGAVDFIPKQLSKVSLEIVKIEKDLQQKVKHVSRRKIRAPRTSRPPLAAKAAARMAPPVMRGRPKRDVVAIGVSTGGPPAVQKVLSKLPANFPAAILIAQHMPAAFTGPFAKRLDSVCQIKVKEASGSEPIVPGTAYIAPGGKHIVLQQRGSRMEVVVKEEPADALYKPSANVLIESVAKAQGRRAVGAIFTGMGNDGLLGIRELKSRGGYILAQNDASCVVYGMPKAIVDAKLTDEILDIDDMAAALMASIYK
ncbi:chemotaxis response regulator protein-glutamate methylesterase [Halodesulfovibrio sp. MK-HDV]|uniref:protein-glutamate methylesterase/protein-glutamine glutaminase n=1 Tax=unclassified Halodesulfovibrio TaxID=2644657 RepID=UPI0013686927|nr:chemotaxis response regulator protein-glutamate methylesterase [Halodesulfovibrio sp. MK-HDV]KAF1075139.1 Chemotaxis response regulator protein-glutamate methylesterase of group 1 operon [Halodesulfovibrio sp. MK-HDV]